MIAGGERADEQGYLIAPTVFEDVADDAFLSCEEVSARSRRFTASRPRRGAGASERGRVRPLGGDLHPRPARQRFSTEVQAGSCTSTRRPPAPRCTYRSAASRLGGWGPHEQGRAALEFYTETVTVYVDP